MAGNMAMDSTTLAIAGATFASGAALGMAFTMSKVLDVASRQQVVVASAPAPEAASGKRTRGSDEPAVPVEMDALRPGFTMEEARAQADKGQAVAMKRNPKDVLEALQRGNVRFWTGSATRPEKSAFERRALIGKQFPATAILSCSDSRVPTEIVFDQGLGDMFVVRCAGNAVTETTCGSLQYAVNHLKVKVLMVMGHEGCGAVKAAGLPEEALRGEPKELCKCLMALKDGLDFERLKCVEDTRAHDREAVISNVKQQVWRLTEDEGIMKKALGAEGQTPCAHERICQARHPAHFCGLVLLCSTPPSVGAGSRFPPVKGGRQGADHHRRLLRDLQRPPREGKGPGRGPLVARRSSQDFRQPYPAPSLFRLPRVPVLVPGIVDFFFEVSSSESLPDRGVDSLFDFKKGTPRYTSPEAVPESAAQRTLICGCGTQRWQQPKPYHSGARG